LARNRRLRQRIDPEIEQARAQHEQSKKPARVFAGFPYQTLKSWSRERRVVAKAEFLDKGENPPFVVTSITAERWDDQALYEKFYCARGEMENRIKEQMCLFADRLSTAQMKGNQLRLYLSALAYTLVEALRRLASWICCAESHLDTAWRLINSARSCFLNHLWIRSSLDKAESAMKKWSINRPYNLYMEL
jgi:hypothetical protein